VERVFREDIPEGGDRLPYNVKGSQVKKRCTVTDIRQGSKQEIMTTGIPLRKSISRATPR
jgi:hypothetical protein